MTSQGVTSKFYTVTHIKIGLINISSKFHLAPTHIKPGESESRDEFLQLYCLKNKINKYFQENK